MATPLRQLMDIHVKEARSLGLLSMSSQDAAALEGKLDAIWNRQPDDLSAFYEGVEQLDNYSASMTWLEYHGKSDPTVHRVARITDLKYPLEGTIGAAGRLIAAPKRLLESTLEKVSATTLGRDPAVESQLSDQLRIVCEDLRGHLCQLPPGRMPAKVKAAKLHSTWTKAWVVPDTVSNLSAPLDAQRTRDTLGLVHYPQRGKPHDLAQSLVHMSFTAHLSSIPLPKISSPDFLMREVKGQWLIRPTICHGPNQRFCQRHHADISGMVAEHGRTIDISNDTYAYGAPELILLHGDDAELTWSDLRLLTPAPASRPIDHDHLGFLRSVASRLGHPHL